MREQEKGVCSKNNNLKTKVRSNNVSLAQFGKNLISPFWVGAFVALSVLGSCFVMPNSASAAENNLGDFTAVKKEISNAVTADNQNSVSSFSADYVKKPLVAETKITKEPPKPVVKTVKKVVKATPVAIPAESTGSDGLNMTANHSFPYGYCTYYVSTRRSIPWSGNAITWLSGARAYGFATGSTPQVGAILVTSEGGRTGHVAMVDGISEDGTMITLTEMNFVGFGRISSRVVPADSGFIMGYIY